MRRCSLNWSLAYGFHVVAIAIPCVFIFALPALCDSTETKPVPNSVDEFKKIVADCVNANLELINSFEATIVRRTFNAELPNGDKVDEFRTITYHVLHDNDKWRMY